MPSPLQYLPPGDAGRDVGLIYHDDTSAIHPAAHVLAIGVAAYKSPKYKKLLQTATISARAVTDWFVDREKARFAHRTCPLGSAALLLSETEGKGRALYAGGEIPRASFEDVRAAVRAWVDRINTHKDNLAILYVASHGESFLNRTAFLLEDYGTDSSDATAGMVEVEQLVGALENAMPVAQLLLFDCCRTPTTADLPLSETAGNKLIALTRRQDDHGEPRKQWVICSTSLGYVGGGLAAGPTLFNMALIDALNGVASDASTEGWPVRPGLLVDKIDRILALHRLPDEKAQTPAGRLAGSFDITFPGEPADVPIYIALRDPTEWPESTITVTINGTTTTPIKGAAGESPFHVCRVPGLSVVEVEAARNNVSLGRVRAKAYPPATFLAIEKSAGAAVAEVASLPRSPGTRLRAKLVIEVQSQASVPEGAVASVVRRQPSTALDQEVTVDIGGKRSMDLDPGDFTVTLRTPDGRVDTRDVTLADGQTLLVQFATQESPHRWMIPAAIAGAIRAPAPESEMITGVAPDRNIAVDIVGGISMELLIGSYVDERIRLVAQGDDGRFARYDVQDDRASRFIKQMSPMAPRVFARVATARRTEFAVIPSLGSDGRETVGGWTPFLLVDRQAASNEHLTSIIVQDSKWAALLGFLASREISAGTILLDRGLRGVAEDAMGDKRSNPLAAVAGALIAVAASNPDIEKIWDPWLRNIADWFMDLPDGPIILGRRLLMRARTDKQIAEARRWFVCGFERGVPFYSLSVDWLARGLDSIPGKDDALVRMQHSARLLTTRVDPTHTFTVIRASSGRP